MTTKNFPDFCPERVGQKSGKILVGMLGETMIHKFTLNLTDLYEVRSCAMKKIGLLYKVPSFNFSG